MVLPLRYCRWPNSLLNRDNCQERKCLCKSSEMNIFLQKKLFSQIELIFNKTFFQFLMTIIIAKRLLSIGTLNFKVSAICKNNIYYCKVVIPNVS